MTSSVGPADSMGSEVDGDTQSHLESRLARLQDESGLTGVAVAVMTDGRFTGVAAAGERRRGSGIALTVDDRWAHGFDHEADDGHPAGRAGRRRATLPG